MVTTSVFLHPPTHKPIWLVSFPKPQLFSQTFHQTPKLQSPQPLKCSIPNSSTEVTQTPPIQSNRILFCSPLSSTTSTKRRTNFSNQLKCSYSNTEFENPFTKTYKNLNVKPLEEKLKTTLLQVTPLDVCKWSGAICILIAATKWIVSAALNLFVWMYFSWTWLFWPWLVAIALAVYGFYCLRKHSLGEANIVEQLAIVTSAFTWVTLVPPAHFNGFFEGWPYVFFFVYHLSHSLLFNFVFILLSILPSL